MDSSQTLTTTPSSSFSNFQASHPLSLHFPTDSPKSLPISKSNRQQSPLQPLHLNPSPKPPLTPTNTFAKAHNASPATSASHLPPTYSSPSTKSVQFPFHSSDVGQKTAQNSSHSATKVQSFKFSPNKEFENDHGSKFSLCSKSSCGDGCSGANCEQNALNVHKGRREDPRDFLKENFKGIASQQTEKFITHQRNIERGLIHLDNPFAKTHNMENGMSSLKLATADKALQGLFDMDHHRFGQERMLSEKLFPTGDEASNESTIEDSSVGRLRACSVGDGGLEGLEMPKTQVLGPKCQNYTQESMKIKMSFGENEFGAGKKRVRQCLNVLCLTDPKDPSLWSKQKVMNSTICKGCFDAFKRGQYCFFCYQIYLDQETSASNDGKDWIECDGCNRWNHIECESVHGLKDIRNLLQGHENTYSYFCPVCRDDKPAKAISRKMKTLMRSPLMVQTVLTQAKQQLQQQQQQQLQLTMKKQSSRPQQAVTPKPIVEEPMETEDIIEEPFGKKVKLNTELAATPIMPITPMIVLENSNGKIVKEKENNEFLSPLDLAKKKLDSVFLKNNANKKRLPPKLEIVHVGGHFSAINDIERLLTLYSGKRIQLSDNEIKADLDLFRELSKSSTCHSEDKSNASEGGMELSMELSEDKKAEGGENSNGMSRELRMKLKIQRRLLQNKEKEIGLNQDNIKDNEEMKEEGDSNNDNFESKRQLRSRKKLE